MSRSSKRRIAILGGGSLGSALARGWAAADMAKRKHIHVTRRHVSKLKALDDEGFMVGSDNAAAVAEATVVILAVQPGHLKGVVEEIRPVLTAEKHLVISVITGVALADLQEMMPAGVPIIRAMPNTAVQTMTSMTCLSMDDDESGREEAETLFNAVGRSLVIDDDMMTPATALCACGIAFFLRTIRAAAQGGTEIGFHAEEALLLAAQTARGAADLILESGAHPEDAIDRVTTPRGCTIAGLNELEHRGFSSAMIRGILTSSKRAEELG